MAYPYLFRVIVILGLLAVGPVLATELNRQPPRHAVFATIADLLPRPRIEALVERMAACTEMDIGANFSRLTVATGMLMSRDGAGVLLGLYAPALALVEPTRSGIVFATIGNATGLVGTSYRLVEPAEFSNSTVGSPTTLPFAIAGGSLLDDEGARHFLSKVVGAPVDSPIIKSGSDAGSVAAVASRRARAAVVRSTIGKPNSDLPPGLKISVTGPTIPLIGFARSQHLAADEVATVERCMFSLRFEPSDVERLGGADRFVQLDSNSGLNTVREIGRTGGARFDRWNYFTARQVWR